MEHKPAKFLYNSIADPLLLGGASFIAFIILRFLNLNFQEGVILAIIMIVLANFMNHPHFFNSYQIFYSEKNKNATLAAEKKYQNKWFMAAYIVPVLLIMLLGYATYAWHDGNKTPMGAMLALMGVLVGWHYVKQGFGMLMMDAGLKKCYWSNNTRKALLINAYCCWGAALAIISSGKIGSALFGIFRLNLEFPLFLTLTLLAMALLSTIFCISLVVQQINTWKKTGIGWQQMPLNGILAYVITLYLWTLFVLVDGAFALVVPFFHSLQYMSVVYRFKLNESKSISPIIKFFLVGSVLGFLGFFGIPATIDYLNTSKIPLFFDGVFLTTACFWIFINIHHYLIDSVMWRKENKYISENLYK